MGVPTPDVDGQVSSRGAWHGQREYSLDHGHPDPSKEPASPNEPGPQLRHLQSICPESITLPGGTSGHDYCGTGEVSSCQNCMGSHCRSADQKGGDPGICRFPELAGGTVPDCRLCSTGCPDLDGSKVWEVPLHVIREGAQTAVLLLALAGPGVMAFLASALISWLSRKVLQVACKATVPRPSAVLRCWHYSRY